MKLFNYLEELITNPEVIEKFILPTLKNKGTFWVPLKRKYTAFLQPKRLLAFHQLGIDYLDNFLNIKKNVSISVFTNTNSIDEILDQNIGRGSGLIAVVEGTPIISSPKDIKSRKERNRKWINFDKNISFKNYEKIKDTLIEKINNYLKDKDLNSFNTKEKNRFISFYYKTVWDILKEKNSKNPDFYKHLSFDDSSIKNILFSKPINFKGNRSNNMSYNEIIMNNIKIKKIYYTPSVEDKINEIKNKKNFFPFLIDKQFEEIFILFSSKKFEADLKIIENQ